MLQAFGKRVHGQEQSYRRLQRQRKGTEVVVGDSRDTEVGFGPAIVGVGIECATSMGAGVGLGSIGPADLLRLDLSRVYRIYGLAIGQGIIFVRGHF